MRDAVCRIGLNRPVGGATGFIIAATQQMAHRLPGVPHNITNVSDKPARVLMTVSPPGHEQYFEALTTLAAQGSPDPAAVADLRGRHDTDQISTLTTGA
ncbi:UNVERIFIED_ORG: molybdopterin-biosynthesis enzyme MoeA-like protein [Rhizobium esperanzae]